MSLPSTLCHRTLPRRLFPRIIDMRLCGLAILFVVACTAPLSNAQAPAPAPASAKCDTVGGACCPASAPGVPPNLPIDQGGNKVSWCKGGKLICLMNLGPSYEKTCQPYPLTECGGTGQKCCPGTYHNPTDKPLPRDQCSGPNDYCTGGAGVCKTNPADCGTLNAKACIGKGQVSLELICKDGLGLASRTTEVCTQCSGGPPKYGYCPDVLPSLGQ